MVKIAWPSAPVMRVPATNADIIKRVCLMWILRKEKTMRKLLSDLEYEFDEVQNAPLTFEQLTPGRRKAVVWTCVKCSYSWPSTVSNRLKGTECPRCRGTIPVPGVTDLATVFPHLLSEWDLSRNLKGPEEYLPYSNKRAAWICDRGHQWEEKINNRTANGLECPFCNGFRPIPSVNDFATLHPWAAAQWDFEKNGKLTPADVFPKSNKRVGWICEQGHRWEAKICHLSEGRGCPICAGLRPDVGTTDLETLAPLIARQWSVRNKGRFPFEFTLYSHYDAWWTCAWGHEYQMPIYRRSRGCNCPVCDGKRIIPGINDLATRAPQMAREWDAAKNVDITPDRVALHDNRKYYWLCSKCGHSWKASPNNRAYGKGCLKCAGQVVDPEINSFAAINSQMIDQWDTEKNYPLTAWDVAAYDNRDYYWECHNGHSWKASPANRTKGTGCPYCAGKYPVVGLNDFGTICPDVAKDWHPSKNGDLLPENFLPNSHEEVWWRCSESHEWKQMIYKRANGSKCPYCQERIPVMGETDLASRYPELAKRWDSGKNKKGPEEYFPDSTVPVYWKCEEGHSFRSPIREMVLRRRCPVCERQKTAPWRK